MMLKGLDGICGHRSVLLLRYL